MRCFGFNSGCTGRISLVLLSKFLAASKSEPCLISLLRPRTHLFDLKLDVCLSGPDQNNNAIYLICFTFLAPREETWQAPPPSGHQDSKPSELSLPSPENWADLDILETVKRLTKSHCYSFYDIDGYVYWLGLWFQRHGWSWQEVRLVPREMILRNRSAQGPLCPRLPRQALAWLFMQTWLWESPQEFYKWEEAFSEGVHVFETISQEQMLPVQFQTMAGKCLASQNGRERNSCLSPQTNCTIYCKLS